MVQAVMVHEQEWGVTRTRGSCVVNKLERPGCLVGQVTCADLHFFYTSNLYTFLCLFIPVCFKSIHCIIIDQLFTAVRMLLAGLQSVSDLT
jgi:hypothetical protein